MVKPYEVLQYLIPNGGWYMVGEDFDGIQFLDCESITKAQYDAGFAKVEKLKADQELTAQAAKEAAIAKLAALGLDLDDLKSLGF